MPNLTYWDTLDVDGWQKEMVQMREMLVKYGKIPAADITVGTTTRPGQVWEDHCSRYHGRDYNTVWSSMGRFLQPISR